jgi:hypothetical protein
VLELTTESAEHSEEQELSASANVSGVWAESDSQHAIQAAAGEALMRSSDNKKSVRNDAVVCTSTDRLPHFNKACSSAQC